jgi:Type IV secretion system pilin
MRVTNLERIRSTSTTTSPTAADGRAHKPSLSIDQRRRTPLRVVTWAALGAAFLSLARADSPHAETVVVVAQQVTSVSSVFTNIRNWLVGILAGLATVFLTIGGVRYLMAGSDPGEVEKAKQAFKSAGWGYGLAALAPLVVEILKSIVGV